MAKLHRKVSKIHPHALLDKESFDQMHPIGTQAVMAEKLKKDQEKALKELEADPSKDVVPMADEEELERARRRRNARMRSGRASTSLSQDEGFGG